MHHNADCLRAAIVHDLLSHIHVKQDIVICGLYQWLNIVGVLAAPEEVWYRRPASLFLSSHMIYVPCAGLRRFRRGAVARLWGGELNIGRKGMGGGEPLAVQDASKPRGQS